MMRIEGVGLAGSSAICQVADFRVVLYKRKAHWQGALAMMELNLSKLCSLVL
jgi:hypothetical protein